MRAAGASDAHIAQQRAKFEAQEPARPTIEVYPENIPAFLVLVSSGDDWEYPGAMGGNLNLPKTQILATMQMLEIPITNENSLRVMTLVRAARGVKVDQWNREMAAARTKS